MIVFDIEVEDQSVLETGIQPGEPYVAKRNAGWKLLECRKYHAFTPEKCGPDDGGCDGFCGIVFPTGFGYPFNDGECFKIRQNG